MDKCVELFGYYIMSHHNRETVVLFKSNEEILRSANKVLFDELLECLKK